MAQPISIQIKGLRELIEKSDPKILATPMKRFWERVGETILNHARRNAPVDTGRLRSSLAKGGMDNVFVQDGRQPPVWLRIGSNVKYAPFMEFGTGAFAEGEGGKGGSHFPPGAALDTWARRHGFDSGFQVARIIARRGGLKPRRYLRDALNQSMTEIQKWLRVLGDEIKQIWDRK